ncbi:MAG: hypothetical protein ABSG15_02020 [FCB group bacterium]|jgi:tetratricopeptide (TPR) repeat protein
MDNKVNPIEQTPEENLNDMLAGCFKPAGLTRNEIVQICTDCINVADYTIGLMTIADMIVDTLSDTEFAREVYKKAEGVVHDIGDYYFLGMSILKKLQDVEWGMELLYKAEVIADENPDAVEYMFLAEVILESTSDKKRSIDLYRRAEVLAIEFDEIQMLADSVFKNLKDREWGQKLLEKAIEKANENPNSHDYWSLAEMCFIYTGDKVRSRELYEVSEKWANSKEEYELLAVSVKDHLHDFEWYRELKKKLNEVA